MAVPPNLPTNHVNDVIEFINAGDINDLATAANARPIVVNAVTQYGADSSGSADSTAAINNALAALPSTGGTVYLPAGSYKINGTIAMGNGTSGSAASTLNGMRIEGVAPPGARLGSPAAASVRLFSGTGSDLIHVNGPVMGWGLKNLHLDGASLGVNGLTVWSAQSGSVENVTFTDWTATACMTRSRSVTGSYWVNTSFNVWRQVFFYVPAVNNATGLLLTGEEVFSPLTAGTSNEIWDNFGFAFTAGASITQYGLVLRGCNDILMRGLLFTGTVPGAGSTIHEVTYDYTTAMGQLPADISIEGVDFGTSLTAAVINVGTPTAPDANKIVNISSRNGRPPNPNLVNLAWGYSNASP